MRDLAKVLLLSAVMLTSVSAHDKNPQDNLYIPERVHIKFKGKGLSYNADVEFYYNGQKMSIPYQFRVNWQTLTGGELDLERVKEH